MTPIATKLHSVLVLDHRQFTIEFLSMHRLSGHREKKQNPQLQPPDLIALQTIGKKATEESLYGTVIKQPGSVESSVDDAEVDAMPNTIYADLQFLSQSFKEPRNESMNLVNEISEPTESLSQPMETERKQMECNGKLKDTVTRA